MKKKILILLGILVLFYAVFSIIDTSEYRVEKQLWRMHKRFDAVRQDPKAVPDAQFEILAQDYRKLAARFPKSRYVPQMYSLIGSVYLLNKKYDLARQTYGEVVALFAKEGDVVSKAMLDIGNTYRIEGKNDKAVEIFQQIWDAHPKTEVGFMMPLYIAGIYRETGKSLEMRQYLGKAVAFYKKMAENTAEPDALRIQAYHMLATAYMGQQNWDSALVALRKIFYEFADSGLITLPRLRVLSRMINVTAVARLQDYNKAITIYQDFINDHPGHVLNQFLEKVIESLNHLQANEGQAVFSQQ